MPTLRWQPIASLVLSVYGLGRVDLPDHHPLRAQGAGLRLQLHRFNCEKVTQSPQSEIFGIPVAMLGLAFFVPMLLLCLPAAWRAADRRIHLARLVLSVTGVGMIIYLIIAELFIIKAICLWCSSVHVATLPPLHHHRHDLAHRARPRLRHSRRRRRRTATSPEPTRPRPTRG